MVSPLTGCLNCNRQACRNMRLSPCLTRRLLSSKSPYLSSPAIACPLLARCTRIWCVRPVLMVLVDHLHTPLAVRQQVLVQGRVDHLLVGRPGPDGQGQVGLAGLTVAELVLQMRQRRALLGQQQDA